MAERTFLAVLAGGSGTRFWPKSTRTRPKQLLPFGDRGRSLLEETLGRFDGIVEPADQLIVTTEALAPFVGAVAGGVRILAEPVGRNSAAAVYWSAREAAKADPRAVVLTMSSDHFIADVSAFRAALKIACRRARETGELLTLGVRPTRAETGYGYIETGERREDGTLAVARFAEKPDARTAEAWFRGGRHLWNAGMFAWRADAILGEFERWLPAMRGVWDAAADPRAAYPSLPAVSVDVAILEKSQLVSTVPLDCGWDDVGNWTALETHADELGLRADYGVGRAADVVALASRGCIVDAPGKLVALLGVEDLIVVNAGETLLVARKDRANEIRQLVERVAQVRPDLV